MKRLTFSMCDRSDFIVWKVHFQLEKAKHDVEKEEGRRFLNDREGGVLHAVGKAERKWTMEGISDSCSR